MSLETLNLREEGAVLFAEITAPPMNSSDRRWCAISCL
jgi:hypothetical protein